MPHRRGRRVPQPAALLRLAGAVLAEAHDEWLVSTTADRHTVQNSYTTPRDVTANCLTIARSRSGLAAASRSSNQPVGFPS